LTKRRALPERALLIRSPHIEKVLAGWKDVGDS